MVLPLALTFLANLVVVLFLLVCLALVLIVLLQKGRGSGLSGAFGGGAAGSLLGTKTGDFLTWVTICLVALFLVLSVLMGKFMRPTGVTTLTPGAPAQTAPATPDTDTAPQTAPGTEQEQTATPSEQDVAPEAASQPEAAQEPTPQTNP